MPALRLFRIFRILIRFRLHLLTDRELLPPPLRWLHALLPGAKDSISKLPRGERIRLALQELGPIFVKFGQLLSTRRDLLPEDIADELALLQDQVPPFPAAQSVAIIEQTLGQPLDKAFARFVHEPMASASIAQVHEATLKDGTEVVVKVVRPDIRRLIEQDLRLLFTLARLMQHLPEGHRLRPVEVVEDYQHIILDELDMVREGANTMQLRHNFEGSELMYAPEIYWDYSGPQVLTMERIDGIPVTDVAALKAQGTDMKLLAERGVEIFFTQVFRDSFFHADMHPGNIFVSRKNPQSPQYLSIDCAIIGTLSEFDQYYLARNLLAIFQRNYREVAELHVECGWVPPETRAHEFESAIRSVCEPIFQKPLSDISFGELLLYLFQVARRFDMEVQPSLVLLQKTLLNVEGLGRQLYPQLDLWSTAQPFLENWVAERYSPRNMVNRLGRRLPQLLEQLPRLPDALIHQAGLDAMPGRQRKPEPRPLIRARSLGILALVAAALLANPALISALANVPAISWLLGLLGIALLLR